MRGIFGGIVEWLIVWLFKIIGRQIGWADVFAFLFWSAVYVCVAATLRVLYVKGGTAKQVGTFLSALLAVIMFGYCISFFIDGRATLGVLLMILCLFGAFVGVKIGDNICLKYHIKQDLNDDIIDAEIIEPKSIESKDSNDKIYCIYCGEQNLKEANFCKNCGKKILKNAESSRDSKGILRFKSLFEIFIALHVGVLLLLLYVFCGMTYQSLEAKESYGYILIPHDLTRQELMALTRAIDGAYREWMLYVCYSIFTIFFLFAFYCYYRYKSLFAYYSMFVLFGFLALLTLIGIITIPLSILYCLVLWYLYENFKVRKSRFYNAK